MTKFHHPNSALRVADMFLNLGKLGAPVEVNDQYRLVEAYVLSIHPSYMCR